jgi:hypothetical protein
VKRLGNALALTAVLLAMFHPLAFSDRILARGDTFNFFYPYWDARQAALRRGELPLWSPELFMGSPLLAEPQMGTFYPLNWLLLPLSTPDAVRVSVLLHVLWAGLGMLWLYRRLTGDRRALPGLAAALTFAFGGFVTAHVEQINQLQGLAWLPWAGALWARLLAAEAGRRGQLRDALLLMGALAAQFFSGHTQTTFLTGAALGLIWLGRWAELRCGLWRALAWGAVIGVGALLLALPQLLPTLELTGLSNRGGGLNRDQATAFSLPPHYAARALLPSYDGLLFTEYLASLGVVGLGLGLIGALNGGRGRRASLLLAGAGLFLALGRFNPLYYEVLAGLPGFNLFRVPSRWLALFALGAALLAGLGTAALQAEGRIKGRWLPFAVVGGLVVWALLPRWAAPLQVQPEDITGGAEVTLRSLVGWGAAAAALAAVVRWRSGRLAAAGMMVELLAASLILPFNDLAPREVYLQGRFTAFQMQAYAAEGGSPPRLLSVSALLFDVGDRAALRSRYEAAGLSEEAVQLAFTALKRQEILGGNLPLTWGVHSADGYGGGLLPTMTYSQLTALLLPADSLRTVDGRIGEMMARSECRGACLPALQRLARLGITHLLTDKVGDVWHEGVGYDAQRWTGVAAWSAVQPFPTEEVRVLVEGQPTLTLALDGAELDAVYEAIGGGLGVVRCVLAEPRRLEGAVVAVEGEAEAVLGVSLVNTSRESFLPLGSAGRAASAFERHQALRAERAAR